MIETKLENILKTKENQYFNTCKNCFYVQPHTNKNSGIASKIKKRKTKTKKLYIKKAKNCF